MLLNCTQPLIPTQELEAITLGGRTLRVIGKRDLVAVGLRRGNGLSKHLANIIQKYLVDDTWILKLPKNYLSCINISTCHEDLYEIRKVYFETVIVKTEGGLLIKEVPTASPFWGQEPFKTSLSFVINEEGLLTVKDLELLSSNLYINHPLNLISDKFYISDKLNISKDHKYKKIKLLIESLFSTCLQFNLVFGRLIHFKFLKMLRQQLNKRLDHSDSELSSPLHICFEQIQISQRAVSTYIGSY